MKKFAISSVLALSMLATPLLAQAAPLSVMQIESIASLLASFGVDGNTIARVTQQLYGGVPAVKKNARETGSFFIKPSLVSLKVGENILLTAFHRPASTGVPIPIVTAKWEITSPMIGLSGFQGDGMIIRAYKPGTTLVTATYTTLTGATLTATTSITVTAP